ncbi:MAG: hypothetical protein ACEY3D_09570 [Rickettsia sp.]|uniref:hypothetical protein n=1 Tax=Rickettsia sp. TaxID=789 RepID=UPI00397C4988
MGIVAWIPKPSLRGAKRRGNPGKIIKKFCKSEFFTRLLRQNFQFFLAMTKFFQAINPYFAMLLFYSPKNI